jgi:hypothetical protein
MCITLRLPFIYWELQRCYLYTQVCITLCITLKAVDELFGYESFAGGCSYVQAVLCTVMHRVMHILNNSKSYENSLVLVGFL